MHVIKPYETAVTLFRVDGTVWVYPSLRTAFKALGKAWIARNVATDFVIYAHTTRFLPGDDYFTGERVYHTSQFVMRDDSGNALTAADFAHLVPRKLPWHMRAYQYWNGEGPVPRTRKPKASEGHYQKYHPANSLRTSITFAEEGEPQARPKRRFENMRYAWCWDDYYPDERHNRSWKYYRKHQWRA